MSTASPFAVIARRWRLAGAVGLVALLVVVLGASVYPKSWTSDAVLQLTPRTDLATVDPSLSQVQVDEGRALSTQAAAATSDAVLQPVARELGTSAVELRQIVTVTASTDADTYTVSATAATASGAQRTATLIARTQVAVSRSQQQSMLASAVQSLTEQLAVATTTASSTSVSPAAQSLAAARAVSLTQRIGQLQTQRALAQPTVQVTTSAELPQAPNGLGLPLLVVLALVVAALLAAAAAFLADQTDRRLRTAEDLVRALGGGATLELPWPPRGAGPKSAVENDPAADPRLVAALRRFPALLRSSGAGGAGTCAALVPVVEQALPADIVLSLARSCAAAGLRTVLVDARPVDRGVCSLLGLTAGPDRAPNAPLSDPETPLLRLLPLTDGHDAGPQLLRELADDAHVVLVDTGDLYGRAASLALSYVDVVVVAAAVGRRGSARHDADVAGELLGCQPARPCVAVAVRMGRRPATEDRPPAHTPPQPAVRSSPLSRVR